MLLATYAAVKVADFQVRRARFDACLRQLHSFEARRVQRVEPIAPGSTVVRTFEGLPQENVPAWDWLFDDCERCRQDLQRFRLFP